MSAMVGGQPGGRSRFWSSGLPPTACRLRMFIGPDPALRR